MFIFLPPSCSNWLIQLLTRLYTVEHETTYHVVLLVGSDPQSPLLRALTLLGIAGRLPFALRGRKYLLVGMAPVSSKAACVRFASWLPRPANTDALTILLSITVHFCCVGAATKSSFEIKTRGSIFERGGGRGRAG